MRGLPAGGPFFFYICIMVSVYRVYNTLKNLANKEQKGFVTPDVFNSFAHIAQLNIFNEIMNESIDAKRLAKAGFDVGSVLSMKERKSEDMMYFYKKVLASNNASAFVSSIQKPSDLYKIIYVTFSDTNYGNVANLDSDYGKCELLYNPLLFEEIKISRLSAFTDQYKIALVGSERIDIYPTDQTEEYYIHYYAVPGSYAGVEKIRSVLPPSYQATLMPVNQNQPIEIFNEQASRNFDLPPAYESELISELANMIGLNLRDAEIQQFAKEKTTAE